MAEMKKRVPFTTALRKYVGMKVMKEVKEVQSENLEERDHTWKEFPCPYNDGTNSVTTAMPSKVIHRANVISITIPTRLFIKPEEESQIPYGCTKRPEQSQAE